MVLSGIPRITQDFLCIYEKDWFAVRYSWLSPFQRGNRAVFGNCDGWGIRMRTTEIERFTVEGLDVLMTHIGGYPGRYEYKINEIMKVLPPKLFISGHSHILKIVNDKKYNLLHINPGAAGRMGIHRTMTCVRFDIDNGVVKNLELFEKDRGNTPL